MLHDFVFFCCIKLLQYKSATPMLLNKHSTVGYINILPVRSSGYKENVQINRLPSLPQSFTPLLRSTSKVFQVAFFPF